MTSPADRATLLRIARDAVGAHIAVAPPLPVDRGAVVDRCAGVFVSIHRRGDLRGCIGHIAADTRLGDVIVQCAVSACSADPRFPPITRSELTEIDIELSILGPLEPITGPEDIEIGRHGLLVEREHRRGLLLPQVATEWKWDAVTFLAQTCRKAGLPVNAWKQGARLWRFEAEVFGETLLT